MSPELTLRSPPPTGNLPGDRVVERLPRDRPGEAALRRKKEAVLPLVVLFEATAVRVPRHRHIEQRGDDLPVVRVRKPFLGTLSPRSAPLDHRSEDPVLGLEIVEGDDLVADDPERWREGSSTGLLLSLVDHL